MGVFRRKLISTAELIQSGKLKIGDGYRARNSELSETGLPFARAGNIDSGFHFDNADRYPEENLSKVGEKVSQPGDVVFTSKGTVGRFAFVRDHTPRFIYSPQLCYWRSLDQEAIDSRWLYYWMQGPEFHQQVAGLKGQTDMADYVSLSDQRRMAITLPDPNEQRAIAAVLGALDDKIEHNRRTAQKLEELARAIFRAWFVDFELVKAKAAGRTSFPSMPQPVFDALPTSFTDTELGPVPEGWEVGKLGDVAKEHRDPVKPAEIPDDTPYIGLEHMPRRSISLSEWETAAKITSNKTKFSAGDILFGKLRPYFHKVGVAAIDGICSTDIVVVKPCNETWFGFVLGLVASDDFVSYTSACSTGTKMPRTNWRDMSRYEICLPPEHVVGEFSNQIRGYVNLMISNIFESKKLAQMRDYLLPKLLSGEVRVRQAERVVEQTA